MVKVYIHPKLLFEISHQKNRLSRLEIYYLEKRLGLSASIELAFKESLRPLLLQWPLNRVKKKTIRRATTTKRKWYLERPRSFFGLGFNADFFSKYSDFFLPLLSKTAKKYQQRLLSHSIQEIRMLGCSSRKSPTWEGKKAAGRPR